MRLRYLKRFLQFISLSFIFTIYIFVGNAKRKIILGWSSGFVTEPWMAAISTFTGCEHYRSQFIFTTNRSLVTEAAAVIFCSSCSSMNWSDMPTVRYQFQRYVLIIYESPVNTFVDYESLRNESAHNFFNWTQTYRRDSDIYMPYGQLRARKTPKKEFRKYTRFAVQFASNCNSWSAREAIVSELQKYVSVDVYGKCGAKNCTCPLDVLCDECMSVLRQYRFYLAFENSVCRDYVTEKFFDRVKVPTLPVVLRAEDYAAIAPRHSFVALDDFRTVAELASYLLYLEKNESAYEEYMSWRTRFYYTHVKQAAGDICPLCEKLLTPTPRSTVPKPYEWWFQNANCANRFGERFVTNETTAVS